MSPPSPPEQDKVFHNSAMVKDQIIPEPEQVVNNPKKRKPAKELPVEKKKKAWKNLTSELPKQQGTLDKWLKRKQVRFSDIVWLNHCIILPLTSYSLPQS